MRKILLLIAVSTLTIGFAQDFVMGITFDAGGKFDKSFNEGTWRGMVSAIDELQAEVEIDLLEFEGTPDTAAEGQRRIALQGAELIVAPGFLQTDAIQAVSSEFPDTNFVLIDSVADNPNVRSVLFKEHEGSYLVGYIAGTMTQTGVVGFVGGMDIPLIRAFDLGYQEGVAASCPDCSIISNYVGVTPAAWNDPTRAKELATTQRAQGADIIYAAAGASGNGVIDFVNENMCFTPSSGLRASPIAGILGGLDVSDAYASKCGSDDQPLFFIGVDSNQNFLGDTDNNPATLNHGLTSMLKRVDLVGYNAVHDVVNDTFESGISVLGVAEDGVGYALDEFNSPLLPSALIDEVESIRQQIIDGDISVTDYRTL
ncbi:MAG: BMP family ABC transporter substrate-binding protein [Trueperaceae bacterium]|nr:MAG: BMP family ABC transporter substrate-binding protein [Trueperaceae bacterium]